MSTIDVATLARPGVVSIAPYQPGKPAEEVERELGLEHIVKLASNENAMGASSTVTRVLSELIESANGVCRYPDGNGFALKAALAQYVGVQSSQITIGNGSNDVLELLARVFARDDDEIVFSQYSFAVYPLVTLAVGAKSVVVPAKQWGHDLIAMANAVGANSRVVFIANPNNPTGTWNSRDALVTFLAQVPRELIVVVDEAYFEYVEQEGYSSCVDLLPRFPNLVVTRTFSKIYGLAALRVGYSISSLEIADLLNRVRQPFNVNSIAQAAALTALKDQDHVMQCVALNTTELSKLEKGFKQLGLSYIPSVGNFICVDVGRPAMPVYKAMLQQGVIVRPVENYAMPNHLRITVGLPDENLLCLNALKNALDTLGESP